MSKPVYDRLEPCHSCGSMPIDTKTGLCRHCNDGGDVFDEINGEADTDEEAHEFEFDCGMDIRGQCGKAGSEECDFECPYSRRGLRTN